MDVGHAWECGVTNTRHGKLTLPHVDHVESRDHDNNKDVIPISVDSSIPIIRVLLLLVQYRTVEILLLYSETRAGCLSPRLLRDGPTSALGSTVRQLKY